MILKYNLPDNVKRYVYRDGNNTVLSKSIDKANNKVPVSAVFGSLRACGLKTAQNVLDYFEIGLPGPILEPHFSVNKLHKGLNQFFNLLHIEVGEWVYPSSLRGGVEECLHQYGCQNFVVRMEHGKNQDRVIEVLKLGYPVMVLVDKGWHWVTVVGYNEGVGFDVLDNTDTTKRTSIDMSFNGPSQLYDKITDTSFQAGTLIFIEETCEAVVKESVA